MIEESITKAKKTGIETIKMIWEFFTDEIPHVLSNWRFVPRAMMLLYCYAFYQTMNWFMALPAPNNAQAGLISVIVGAGAAWFGLYVNSTSTKHEDIKVETVQQSGSMSGSTTVTATSEPTIKRKDL